MSGAPFNWIAVTCRTRFIDGKGLEHEHLDLGDEEVGEDHHVWRAIDENLVGCLAVEVAHLRDAVRSPFGRRSEPAHRLADAAAT
jgi:hypothetical protein